MRTRGTICSALLIAVVAVVIVWGTAWGQTATSPAQAYARDSAATYMIRQPQGTVQFMFADAHTGEMQKLKMEDRKLDSEVQAALREYARAEEDSRKEELRRKLSEALQEQFEIRQRMRDQEIAELEQQIKRLRDLFEKRAAAKERIVDARLDQLIRAAEGLGWDASVGAARNNPFGVDPVQAVPMGLPASR